ncbi:unnamed protein product [Penicillium viridicatum]
MAMIPNFILGPHNRLRPKTLDPMQTPYSLPRSEDQEQIAGENFPLPPTAPQKGVCPSRDKLPNGAGTFYHSCPSPRRVIIDVVNDIDGTPCSMISMSYASKAPAASDQCPPIILNSRQDGTAETITSRRNYSPQNKIYDS